jgi:hypothetical protein
MPDIMLAEAHTCGSRLADGRPGHEAGDGRGRDELNYPAET